MLRCIDIASWQEGIRPSQVDCDVVIVKATGGNWYENPFFEQWADEALAAGKLLGIYHYAVEETKDADAEEEARFFLSRVSKYRGMFVPILDWEADACGYPQEWARTWMDVVAEETGATPMFYGYASHVNGKDYGKVAKRCPLWMASYLDKYDGAGWVDSPTNRWGTGSWPKMACYQYTSTGRVSGYNRDLDLSVFYGGRDDWISLCGGENVTTDYRGRIVAYCRQNIGCAYDTTPSGGVEGRSYNCSYLSTCAYAAAGLTIPGWQGHQNGDGSQSDWVRRAGNWTTDPDELRAGDLVFFGQSPYNTSHVGVSLGGRRMIDSVPNGGVRERTLYASFVGGGWPFAVLPEDIPAEDPEPEQEEIDYTEVDGMIECIIEIEDDHCGYKKGMRVYWNPVAGFEYVDHPDGLRVADRISEWYHAKGVCRIQSSSASPWVVRLLQLTAPSAKGTFGKVSDEVVR